MFYVKGIDITNDKQMFNFLKNHFKYCTMNSWNRVTSIANNVKLHRLNLSGDWYVAYNLLINGEYDNINWIIADWQRDHNGYEVYFNGRSGGYLILKEDDTSCGALPSFITACENYEDYKSYCKEYYGSVKANRSDLVFYTKLVQDFDKLCDELRDYCDKLSNLKFEVIEMEKSVEYFNEKYADDLELLGFRQLHCDGDGKVDVEEIAPILCLFEAFMRIADRSDFGYTIKSDENGYLGYIN
jgi:hypothetical protein